jgi:hypothetical protein
MTSCSAALDIHRNKQLRDVKPLLLGAAAVDAKNIKGDDIADVTGEQREANSY